ncbi:hypothetical protein KJ554_06740 [bacterium]|nr:hypothetical protein [bacterium]
MRFPFAVLFVMLAIATTACVRGAPCPEATEQLASASDVTSWPPAPYRWRDIATNPYAQSYQGAYLYDDAAVAVTYTPCECITFAGHLSAVDLKPNFAYQIKLVGKPTGLWGDEGDDVANEMIGFTGRWWHKQPDAGNSNDADYIANHDDPDYIFEGYLLLDFFITNPDGTAEVDFAVDSSFHVLWWEHQRTPGACDSPVKRRTVIGSATDPAYDTDVGPTDVGVYAEIERLCYGESTLPPGAYDCRLLLTEESFHQSGDGDGYWASAMSFDHLRFEVVETLVDVPGRPAAVRLGSIHPNPFNPLTTIRYELTRPTVVHIDVLDAAGALVRRLIAGARMPAGSHAVDWRGRHDNGRRVAAGVYLVRMRADGIEQTKAVTLLK